MYHSALFLTLSLMAGTGLVTGPTYPNALNVAKPNPEPALPAAFDTFTPPVVTANTAAGTPIVAEWTKIGKPDDVLALTGSQLSSHVGTTAGQDTQFHVFGQGAAGTYSGTASVQLLDGVKAAVVLPAGLPDNAEYFLWPMNSFGAGNPIAVNATESWWIGPNAATRGDTVSVFGRNLASAATNGTSYVYIQKNGVAGVWATVTAANPYKVDFTVPASLTDGDYQIWIHNTHGGHYGWSGPLTLTVNDGNPWTAQRINVKDYGAKGDGVTDDEAAINNAMNAAGQIPWSTLYFPTGTYMVSRGFYFPSQVRWLGDGATKTFLRANSGFVTPATWDARRYSLLFSNSNIVSATFQDLTIDANNNMNGYLNMPIYMRFDTDLRFINVTINAKGYCNGDFTGSNRVSFQNCSLIGGGVFFGSATQVFLDRCHIYGTNDANTLLSWWGGDGMSCTNTTVQDYDSTAADGCAQGRFFYGSSQWGSNRDIYVGNNTTVNLGPRAACPEQNTGEQIAWENGTKYSAQPTSANATTVTFANNAEFQDPGLATGIYDAVIVNGTGLGQHRKIVGCTGSTITVSPAWNVPPDGTSIVLIAGVVSHCAVYDNTLQGKSDYATRETADLGVQPYGNSYDLVIDSNTISQMRYGITMSGMNDTSTATETITCVYFNYVANNTVFNCYHGFYGRSAAWNGWPAGDPYPGITYFGNTCVGNSFDSPACDGIEMDPSIAPIGDQMDLSVFDHNLVTNASTALDLPIDSRLTNTVLYDNGFYAGAAPADTASSLSAPSGQIISAVMTPNVASSNTTAQVSAAVATPTPSTTPVTSSSTTMASTPVVSTSATVSNPTTTAASAPTAPALATSTATPTPVATKTAAPSTYAFASVAAMLHGTVMVAGSAHGSEVQTSFNVGRESSASWTATSSATWLTATPSTASSVVVLTCNPAALSAGKYSGIVTLKGPGFTRKCDVTFVVR